MCTRLTCSNIFGLSTACNALEFQDISSQKLKNAWIMFIGMAQHVLIYMSN